MNRLEYVSIDFLLDDEDVLDKTIIREQINLDDYVKEGKLRNKKDAVVYAKYPNADIVPLLAQKKSTEDKFEIGNYKYLKCVYKVEK